MEPVIALCILDGQTLFINGARTLRERCVQGIEPDRESCRAFLERSIGIVTALNPVIGYEKGAATAKQAYKEGRPILDVAREATGLPEEKLKRYLDPMALTKGGILAGGGSAGG